MKIFSVMVATIVAAIGGSAAAQTSATLTLTPAADVWHYFNAIDGATRELAPPFLVPTSFPSDRRDAVVVLKFQPELPPAFPANWRVAAAKVRVYDIAEAAWQPTGTLTPDGAPQRLEMFAAGFGPTYLEAGWTGTEPFIGGNNTSSAPRDPFPRDLVTNANVQNEVFTQTPWALGTPVGYTPGAMSAPFPIDYILDVDNPTIQSELRADLENGFSTWIISPTFEANFMGDPGLTPNIIMSEGVAARPGSQPPTLILTIEETAANATNSWLLLE